MPRRIRIAVPASILFLTFLATAAIAQTTQPGIASGNLASPASSDDASSRGASALRTNFRPSDAAVRTWLASSPSLQTRPASRASLKSRRSVKPAVVWVP